MDNALQRLADAAGIEPRYWDIQGNLHECSAETARALLEAMGIPAVDEKAAQASLHELNQDQWREILPPVLVAREGQHVEVPVRLPEGGGHRLLHWSIISEDGREARGEWHLEDAIAVSAGEADGQRIALRRLRLPPQPSGYHRIRLAEAGETTLIVSPPRCYLPPGWDSHRYWGVAAQLYSIRSARNWGMGDFGDLAQLTTWPIDTIGINPLHALFLDVPDSASPYAPCSRLFANPLYLDVAAVAASLGMAMDDGIMPRDIANLIDRARSSDMVDYPAIARAKLFVLERLFRKFEVQTSTALNDEFHAFMATGGTDLERFTSFQALSEHLGGHDWMRWPQEFRDPNSRALRLLPGELKERSVFFAFLQWQTNRQLSEVVRTSHERGMRLGIYNDLAVSSDARSADHWANQQIFMGGARVGAPPDPFNERGQEWGIVPLDPRRLRRQAYAYFIALLRANMRHAGVLRVDHVMGLMRLFMIPAGAPPGHGAYVRYPFDDLLDIVALESVRHACVVIGEDLGTVPGGFRERMADANILSSRVLYFEREHGRFRTPGEFPPLATVSVSTHDLATLRGYWTNEDIIAKDALGIFTSPEEKEKALADRASDKSALLQALAEESLLLPGTAMDAAGVSWSEELATAVHAYLARSQCKLLLVQLDDLAGEKLQANLPGSTSEYPSWRRRLHRSIEELSENAQIRNAFHAIAAERNGVRGAASGQSSAS